MKKLNEGDPLKTEKLCRGAEQKTNEKSLIVPKKIYVKNIKITKGFSLICFRGSGRRFFLVLDKVLRFRMF